MAKDYGTPLVHDHPELAFRYSYSLRPVELVQGKT